MMNLGRWPDFWMQSSMQEPRSPRAASTEAN